MAPVQWSCMIFRNRWLLSAIPQEFCRNVRIPRREKGKQGKFSCLPSTILKDLESRFFAIRSCRMNRAD